jgi:hypothetical protein
MSKRKVRILFVNCPNLDVEACTYLLLAQNLIQSVFEFEVCHHWISLNAAGQFVRGPKLAKLWSNMRIFGSRPWGSKKAESVYWAALERSQYPFLNGEIGTGDMLPLQQLVAKHEEWLQRNQPNYGGAQEPLPTVVITETALGREFISNTVGRVAVVTLADWQRQFAPPSALEFILLSVQRLSTRVVLQTKVGSHYPTRGCIWDFTANVADTKSTILIGYVCTGCRKSLSEYFSEAELREVDLLARRSWLGKLDDPGSIASNLKRVFAYDLSTTRGLKLSLMERLPDILWSEESAKFFFFLLLGFLLWFLAQHNIKLEAFK